MGAIFYGIVIVLFFQCMGAFFDPTNRANGGIKWGLVVHTIAMFSLATAYIAMSANIQSISFIDNRAFPATVNGVPGPVGFQFLLGQEVIGFAPTCIILLNGWLADALLLYRCYVVYAKNCWAIAIPCLMYLASVGTGILFNYETSRPDTVLVGANKMVQFGAPYFSVAFALNIVLTVMITVRLTIHGRNIRNAMGDAAGTGGLYKATVAIIVESYALFAVVVLLFMGTWAAKSFVQYIFLQILAQMEVIAPLLMTLRIANRRAFTSDSRDSGNVGPIHFRSGGKTSSGNGSLSGGYPTKSMDAGELGVGVQTTVDLHRDSIPGARWSPKT